jgi:acyl-CoA thioester hydrolase
MASLSKQLSFRWSDLDPNFHVRHSAYYDFGAQHRIEFWKVLA